MRVSHIVGRTALHLSPDMMHQESSASHLLHLPKVQERGAKNRQVTCALQQRLALNSSPGLPKFPTSTALSHCLGASKRRISSLSHHHTELCSPYDQMSALFFSLHMMQEMMQEKLLHILGLQDTERSARVGCNYVEYFHTAQQKCKCQQQISLSDFQRVNNVLTHRQKGLFLNMISAFRLQDNAFLVVSIKLCLKLCE